MRNRVRGFHWDDLGKIPEEPWRCSHTFQCRMTACHTLRTRYVYGLWDEQLQTIFYVGSSFNPFERFSRHIREHEYAKKMLEHGAFPILLVLLEYTSQCDEYSRYVERLIARQLRELGHLALGDDIWHREYVGVLDEQAKQAQFLRDVWRDR